MLCAHLIPAYPQFKALNPRCPLVERVDVVLRACMIPYEDLLSWSTALSILENELPVEAPNAPQCQLINHQAAVINELVELSKSLSQKLKHAVDMLNNKDSPLVGSVDDQNAQTATAPTTLNTMDIRKRRKSPKSSLVDSWYAWYTNGTADFYRQKKVETHKIVTYMRLFAGLYVLSPAAADFKDQVLAVGEQASSEVLMYFNSLGVAGASTGTALKLFRKLHRDGKLTSRIHNFYESLNAGLITDPSSSSSLRCMETI
jgi:hypothetical protein